MSLRTLFLVFAVLAASLVGLPDAHAATPVILGPVASTQYDEAFPVHGIGGDERVIFACQPSDEPGHDAGVWVSHRLSGNHLGQVTPPPGGWGAPLALKVVSYADVGLVGTTGTMIVLDGFTPQQAGTRPGIVYEYSYSYTFSGGLSTTLTGTHPLPMFTGFDGSGMPLGPLYPISIARVPDTGELVVIDFLLGSIWVSDASHDVWRLGMIDPRFEAGELASPLTGIGRAPGGGTRPYVFSTVSIPPFFPFSILPGIHGVAYCDPTDEVAVLRTATPGGVYGIPRDVLFDASTPPYAKGGDVREIAPPEPGVTDLAVGLDYDRWNPRTPWLYWQRAIANTTGDGLNPVYRVHLFTGEIQELSQSASVYDWTNEISVLPSHLGPLFTVLTNANMQEENLAESNALLGGVSTLVGPTVIPIAAFSNW